MDYPKIKQLVEAEKNKGVLYVDMDKTCHKQIDDFTDKLMVKWRKAVKNKKGD